MLHSTAPEVSHLPKRRVLMFLSGASRISQLPAKRACSSPREILKCTRLWIIGVEPYDRAAHALGITERSLRSLVQRNKSTLPEVAVTPTPTASPLDNFTTGDIRRHVHRMFSNKQSFTVRTVAEDIKTADIIPSDTSDTAVWRILHSMGFRYKTTQRKMYVRKESLEIVCWRINTLRLLKEHREEGRQVVYIDETWFTTRMHPSREWVDTSQSDTSDSYSRQVPPGEGERFVVVAAGTVNGFIEDSLLCFPAKNKSGDYHGKMNATLFIRWLTTSLLPALAEPSVLVIDNKCTLP
ncbi:hypothetical protein Pcinc_005802 [Petrolisthes cinctipes]|uniref:Uncharacterized protein n=1 Tax=Petrolisthes cinctipes TaxID=88211 RepID=A0AAE1GE98_PETCI|nr:hypothetical protein Pcinc_005752 [Petrolisthes cinctipes]KAK3890252.1 hypothetical protein Pcinc_005785 [Petrolisthes cinctipes]KAK3890271.1 hypothetical protein Pcinc_005802 [Petrolisthes cinctipes]